MVNVPSARIVHRRKGWSREDRCRVFVQVAYADIEKMKVIHQNTDHRYGWSMPSLIQVRNILFKTFQ